MQEALDSKPEVSASNSNNYVEELFANMIEETYYRSPYVSDTYRMPYNADDLYQRTFDYSIYEKMCQDDQVSVCLQLKKDLIMGDGAAIVPSDDSQIEMVKELNKIIFDNYEGNFVDDLEEILSSYEFGFSLTEKVFKIGPQSQLNLKHLRTRHPNTWLIYQNPKGDVTNFVQKTSEGDITVKKTALIHFINNKKFQNPYGTSDLRAAYNAWIAKVHVMRYFSIYLEKAASPIPVGRYEKNAPAGFKDTLLNILKKFQTKTAIAISKDVEIEFLEAKSNGEAYHKAISIFNMIIGRALFIPDLIGLTGSETGGGSYSLGKEQMNLFFMHILRRRNSLEQAINKEIMKLLIQYNYGFIEKPPQFKFNALNQDRALELAKIWLEAVKSKTYKPNEEEINHFRKLVNFPEGEVEFQEQFPIPPGTGKPEDEEIEDEDPPEPDKKSEKTDDPESKKEFAKAYDATPGDYSRKVDFKAMKTKLDDYDKSLMNETAPIVNKMLMDLYDQVSKKKIVQNQNVERIDGLTLKYKKDLKTILKNSFYQLYRDSINQAKVEVTKSNFAKPLDPAKFLEVLDEEVFQYVGDYEYAILKKTRVELIAAIKDGRPLSSVLSVLSKDLEQLSQVSLERYGRTKHTEVMNNGRYDYFQSTGVVTGYQYSAIMDDRTSDICSGLHGKFFTADNAPIPPMHFNCRSTLIPITKFESFKPTETIRGESVDKFIEDNKGSGFGKYSLKEDKVDTYEPDITDYGVEFETEYLNDKTELIKYSLNGKVFKETTIIYRDNNKIEGDYASIKHRKLN